MADNKSINVAELLNILDAQVVLSNGSSASNYKKSIASLRGFLSSHEGCESIAFDSLLENWIVFLAVTSGRSLKTCIHYVDLLSGLYTKAVASGMVGQSDAFALVKAKLRKCDADKFSSFITDESYKRLLSLLRNSAGLTDDLKLSADILLFSLLNAAIPLISVAKLRKDSLTDFDDDTNALTARIVAKNRSYVFPLSQSGKTDRQLSLSVNRMIIDLFDRRNIIHSDNIQDTVRCYWAYAALRCGVMADEIISVLGCRPVGLPAFAIVKEDSSVSEPRRREICQIVGAVFSNNPVNWYAMKLRPRVKFRQLRAQIESSADQLPVIDMFYPCEEIARRVNKKIVKEQKPVLPDIVFFKSRYADIRPLFSKIGDLAWCYTSGDRYAAIPDSSMEHFQRTIGKFSPDYEVGPVGSIALNKGDKIVVLSGPFSGYRGEVAGSSPEEYGTVYRIMIFNDQSFSIEWRVNDPRLVQKQ